MKPYKLSLFKVLSDRQQKSLNIQSTLDAWYHNNSEDQELKLNKEQNQYSLESIDGLWNVEDYGFGINLKLSLDNACILYGLDGIADHSSEISMVVTWKSSSSKDRGVLGPQCVKNVNETQVLTFSKRFDKHTYHGVIELSVRLVLTKSGAPETISLNNTPGVIIGEIEKLFINVDGSGSLFPIINIHDKEKSLWQVKMDFTDPTQDLFVDSFKIVLNTAHKDYVFIDLTNKEKYCSRLVSEIVQQAIIALLTKLLNEKSFIELDNIDYQEGSVLQVVKYMIDTKEFDVSSVESIINTVSNYFDKRGV